MCWSCQYWNLSKSSNLTGRDPITRRAVLLFNARRQRWSRHFLWDGPVLVGRTGHGRATIDVLNIAIFARLIKAHKAKPPRQLARCILTLN